MPEIGFREDAVPVDKVLSEYDRRKDQLLDLGMTTKNLVETILKEERISFQSVQMRIKSREKVKTKYCRSDKNYRRLDDLSDLVGIRIIAYYSDSIDLIARIMQSQFSVPGPVDDKRKGRPESHFGYNALHLDCGYSDKRLECTEYSRLKDAQIEVQITTVLGHAWAEMHHEWYDSEDSPREEERRFYRLAAVLELAEQEFLDIRIKKEERDRSSIARVKADAPEIQITPETLKAFIEEKDIVGEIDEKLGKILGMSMRSGFRSGQTRRMADLILYASISTVQELEAMLTKAPPALEEFVARCAPVWRYAQFWDATYLRGFCITQFANLLISAGGEDKYNSYFESRGLGKDPRHDLRSL
jgi:ppGpp synthetase/RelA/SpoT-type nucleotidyltranferase